jgi:hypothetical protein
MIVQYDEVTALSAGVLSYGCIHALSCLVQGRIFGISTGTRAPIPSLLGIGTISVASFVSHVSSVCINHYCKERKRNKSISESIKSAWSKCPSIVDRPNDPFTQFWSSLNGHNQYLHTMRICVVGMICFKLLGGRFWTVSPSSYTHVGSYARGSIAATDLYATPAQRVAVQGLGRLYGCHTCGTKTATSFIGDHQPPKSVAYQLNQQWFRRLLGWKVPFRFYPHCSSCSNKQGGILASAIVDMGKIHSWNQWFKRIGTPNVKIPSLRTVGGGQNAYIHGIQPRLHFLTGGIIAAIATSNTSDQGRQRYIDMQSSLSKALKIPIHNIYQLQQQFYKTNKRHFTIRPIANVSARQIFDRRSFFR